MPSHRPSVENSTAVDGSDAAGPGLEPAEDLLVEEVSIDGMCGVY
ncbi:mycofactocin precursor MftA [Arthrobacter sp. 7Tela_A1]